jgi:hypothetical protein
MQVHVYSGAGAVIGVADGAWKTLSVQFRNGAIASVDMQQGQPGEITAQVGASSAFFQAAELGGAGRVWPNGLAATVTFAPGTDMSAVTNYYASINT